MSHAVKFPLMFIVAVQRLSQLRSSRIAEITTRPSVRKSVTAIKVCEGTIVHGKLHTDV